MIIKKFTGKTESDAVENAKKELGLNVVVMNVKNVKRKGFFDFLKPQMVEVTVALEEETNPGADPVSADVKAAVSAINEVVSNMNGAQIKPAEPQRSASVPPAGNQEEAPAKKESKAIEEKLDSLQTLLEQQLQKPEEEKKEKKQRKKKGFLGKH